MFSLSDVLAIIQNGVTAVNNLNIQLRGSLTSILASITAINAAWTAYTPTVTASAGTFTTVAATGRYKQNGKTVFFSVNVVVTNAGTAATATLVTFPVTASASARAAFSGRENALSGVGLTSVLSSQTQFAYQKYDGAFIGAAGMSFDISGTYEAA